MTPTRKFRFTVSWPKLAGELEWKSKDPKVSPEKRKTAEKSAHNLRAFMPLHWKLRNRHYAGERLSGARAEEQVHDGSGTPDRALGARSHPRDRAGEARSKSGQVRVRR